jgi:hypothetical protein
MSIYFALEYDENGVSRIVQKKDTSTRAVTQRDFNLGTYVGNQITSPEDPNQPDEGDTTGDFISQMGTGTMGGNEMTDFERFIDRGNLIAFMDKGGKDTKFINAIFAAMGVPVTAEGLTKFFDGIAKILPEESEEVKRIRKFYATEGKDYMDPSKPNYIPGMENYNIVYGNIFDPQSGLQDAFKDRMDTIANTLGNESYMKKYGLNRGLTAEEIQSIIDGTYAGPITPLTKRYKNLNDVSTLEFNFKYDDDKSTDTKDKIDFGNIDTGVQDFSDTPTQNIGTLDYGITKGVPDRDYSAVNNLDRAREQARQRSDRQDEGKGPGGSTMDYSDPLAPGDAD